MGASYKLEETRLVQWRTQVSAANSEELNLGYPGVPQGKIWIVLGITYMPSVNEAQLVSFEKYTNGGYIVLLNPLTITLNPLSASFLEQGMEYMLLPGEYVRCRRANHTAASTMSGTIQFIEIDQPLYTYEEPQIVRRQQRALSSIRTALGGGAGRGSGGGERPGSGGGGGRGRGLPV